MKLNILLCNWACVLLFVFSSCKSPTQSTGPEKLQYSSKYIYFVCRGSNTKAAYIAKDYNIKDSLISHAGIGVYENKKLNIYNVNLNTIRGDSSALYINSLKEFSNHSNAIQYIAIYRYPIRKIQRKKIQNFLHQLPIKQIQFDNEFSLTNSKNKLYCSELIYLALKEARINTKNLVVKKKLNRLHSSILQRDSINYIPVDFFLHLNGVEKVVDYVIN